MAKRNDRGGLIRAGDLDFLKGQITDITATATAHPPAIPTAPEHDNQQMSLFRDFLYNREEERENLSIAIDLWDNIPRYSVSRQAMTKARENGRFLENYTASLRRARAVPGGRHGGRCRRGSRGRGR